MSTSPGSEVEGSKGASSKTYIRHSTSDSISGSSGKPKKNNSRRYKRKPQKPISYHDYEKVSDSDARYAKENGQHRQDLQATATGQTGMGQE
jgi:hypothetical protein